MQSEYGWRDHEMLEVPLRRFQQIVELIQQRLLATATEKARLVEWHAKVLASFVSATAQVDKDGQQALLGAVEKLRLLADDQEVDSVMEQGALPSSVRDGSYEAFMSALM